MSDHILYQPSKLSWGAQDLLRVALFLTFASISVVGLVGCWFWVSGQLGDPRAPAWQLLLGAGGCLLMGWGAFGVLRDFGRFKELTGVVTAVERIHVSSGRTQKAVVHCQIEIGAERWLLPESQLTRFHVGMPIRVVYTRSSRAVRRILRAHPPQSS